MLIFDGDNASPGCECCGRCCRLNVLALTADEVRAMRRPIREHDVKPEDKGGECCPFLRADSRCDIWDARPQPCRLYSCRVPRVEVLRQNPRIVIPEDLLLVDLHEEFVAGNVGQWVVPRR